ncbi:UDP-N-acetylenolpyruvoylglucosamine reductase [Cladobotryum mycophilum]|uniref:UDP-N-acetylenolpyruvoylglucosamine reductase n=1 Tax=Cladobotryum mycophilum TaxID=491253 RepID=A0ABR0S8T8_9HYPO
MVLGGGSNILFASARYDGIVLKNEILGIQVISQDPVLTVLRVGGGVVWNSLVEYCLRHALGGLENLSMIPGTVGAAPVQNIGAYGSEVSEVLESVDFVHLATGEAGIFKHSLRDVFISTVVIKLTNAPHHQLKIDYDSIRHVLQSHGAIHPTISSVKDAVCLLRSRKLPDPDEFGNAGSFFKNAVVEKDAYEHLQSLHPSPQCSSFIKPDGSKVIPAAWLIQ